MTTIERETRETSIRIVLNVDGAQTISISTGQRFFDHLLHQMAFHAGWDLEIDARGDLDVDDHHLVEDVGLALGSALDESIRDRGPIRRYGQRLLPMDDALVLCAVDLGGGRPFASLSFDFEREAVGGLATEMIPHFFRSTSTTGRFTLHIRQIAAENHHHLLEAAFKGFGVSMREALERSTLATSTKDVAS